MFFESPKERAALLAKLRWVSEREPHVVKLWYAQIDEHREALRDLAGALPNEEQVVGNRIRHCDDWGRFILTRTMIRYVGAACSGLAPLEVKISRSSDGKPFF